MTPLERTARAICAACGERADAPGDCRGNEYRWQDYVETAKAAIEALAYGGVLVRMKCIGGCSESHPIFLDEENDANGMERVLLYKEIVTAETNP